MRDGSEAPKAELQRQERAAIRARLADLEAEAARDAAREKAERAANAARIDRLLAQAKIKRAPARNDRAKLAEAVETVWDSLQKLARSQVRRRDHTALAENQRRTEYR